MKFTKFFIIAFILVEAYGQRIRTSNTNQDVTNEQTQAPRGRGRSRFSTSDELAQVQDQTERTTTNRRASRTRIHSNNPKAAADRRARPTESSTSRGYAVEEVNNDSPIESFRRQSKPRVLTDDIPTVTVSRRPIEASTALPINTVTVEDLGFGSTARAILQARGQPLPVQTTTPVVDEEYLRANFGSTIRSLAAAAGRSAAPVPSRRQPASQRAVLRSETPIISRDDIPVRRTSLRGDPLPSLRGSDVSLERGSVRSSGRSRNIEPKVTNREETENSGSERTVVEDFVRINPEEIAPQSVEGLPEQPEIITEPQSVETMTDLLPEDENDFKKTSSIEITTPRATPLPTLRRVVVNNRRNNGSSRTQDEPEESISRSRGGSRIRARIRTEEPRVTPSRARANRRRFDDAEVAESRDRGPSVFTAEQYVTPRLRTGRRIDTRYEAVPQVPQTTPARSRNSARRVETTNPTSSRTRGRGRSFTSDATTTTTTTSKPSNKRGRRVEEPITSRREGIARETTPSSSRKISMPDSKPSYPVRGSAIRSSIKHTTEESTPSHRRGSVEERSKERSGRANVRSPSTTEATVKSRTRGSRFESPDLRKESKSVQATPGIPRTSPTKQIENNEQTTIYYGEKSVRTEVPEITTVLPIETTPRSRSRSRTLESLKIDESKLEVLPLFERESKYVDSPRRGLRSKSSRFVEDHLHGSATENDVRFVEKPTTNAFTRMTVTRTESVEASTSRVKISSRVAASTTTPSSRRSTDTVTRLVETTTKPPSRAPPIIKETVLSEINQVTSKSTITRKKKVPKAKANEVLSRGIKKSDVKFSDVVKKKSAEEDIGEDDNYPAPFKALIQAKKLKEEPRSPLSQPAARTTTSAPLVKAVNTERIFVTSAGASRSALAVTTTTVASRKLQKLNEIVNENENELEPKSQPAPTTSSVITTRPSRTRQLPKFSEKPKYQSKSKDKFYNTTPRTTQTTEKATAKTTTVPRKTYSRNTSDYHSRRKVLRSTAVPPSTPATIIKENKFSAKFIKKEDRDIGSLEKSVKSLGDAQPKGLFSSRKGKESEGGEEKIVKQLDVALIQNTKPIQPIKKSSPSRYYSSRFRSDISTRSSVIKTTTSAPFYIPTIPTPAYVPTVPTVTPSTVPEDGVEAETDESGLQIISFDVPVRGVLASADLVNGELLTTDKNLKLSPLVKDGTTEKPVSIIERIINSITLISTTEAPNNVTNPSTTTEPSENSAILKLANKKTTTKDKTDVQTNIIETITSEKPTTIIEKIRSSLSAIQTNEVGTEDVFVSSSTTPLSTVTKYSARYRGSSTALPAPLPLSTSITPPENQALEKNTIGRLLNILNGLVSPEPPAGENLVVVTPKSAGFIATTFSAQEPIEAITLDSISASTSVNTETSTDSSTVNFEKTTLLVDSTDTLPDTTTPVIRYTETPTSVTPASDFTEAPPFRTPSIGSTIYTFSSIPSHPNINVSPGSVSIFSANDLSNYVTPVDNFFNTVTIASRVGFDNTMLTTDSPTTTEGTTEGTTDSASTLISTVNSDLTTTEIMSTTTVQDETTTMLTPTTVNTTFKNRSGRILSNDLGAPVDNNIDAVTPSITTSTTPDYFIFAVLNNNTILRKRPPTVPNKETPFIIVGLYPNNTLVRKFPNGTLVPMDPVIKVRGFDTRPNPPPLVEITSNQVTDTNANGMTTPEDNNSATIESNRMARLLEKEKTSTVPLTTKSPVSTTKPPVSTSTVSSTTPSTTNMPSTTSLGSDLSSTTLDPSTTDLPSTLPPSTTIPPKVEIMAVPGATRISKSQSTTMPSTTTIEMSTAASSSETIPSTLGEILNGRTVDALNKIIRSEGSSTTSNYKTLSVNKDSVTSSTNTTETSTLSTTASPTTIETDSPFSFSTQTSTESITTLFPNTVDRLASSTLVSTLMPISTTTTITTMTQPTTTTVRTTTKPMPTVRKTTPRSIVTTAKPVASTMFPVFSPSTIVPTILTTLFPSFMATTAENRISSSRKSLTNAELTNSIADNFEVLSTAGSTARPSTVLPQSSISQKISTTTTQSTTTTTTTTTTTKPTTTKPKTTTVISTKEETDKLFEELKKSGKLKNLSQEQRKNLEEIERIEKEQSELIKQLTMLTSMFGGQRNANLPSLANPVGGSSNSLANRVINMAIERDRKSQLESKTTTTKRPNSIQDQLPVTSVAEESTRKTTPSLEDILKQYNLEGLSTQSPLSSTYGKTDEALLASILKDQGIGPTTPKALGDKVKEAGLFEQATSTKKPKPKPKAKAIPTTARPALGGRLMQGLNWLLDILDPPTTKKPAPRKPKAKPAKQNAGGEEELLSNQPTRITPMVTAAPVTKPSLSQDEIKRLIKQLENVQKNPNTADQLDFSKIKSLQNLIEVNDAVEITHSGQHGARARGTSRPQRGKASTDKDPFLQTVNKKTRSSTLAPNTVSNSIDDDVEEISTTIRPRGMPPVSLNPIHGIDDQGDSMIRSNLLTAAVNVTRAISSFIGSAFQGATRGFRSLMGSGSSMVGNIAQTSSVAG